MNLKYIPIVAFVIFTSAVYAQNTTIIGKVTLSNSIISLPGINVYTKNNSAQSITNIDGNFLLSVEKNQNHTILVSGIGFKTIAKVIRPTVDELRIDFELSEEIIDLPIVQINAHSATGGMMGSMEIPGSTHYISSRELNEIQSTNPNEILQRIPGVQIQEEDGFGLRPNIGLRASGSERSSKITILEDGVLAAPAPYSAPSAYYFPTIGRMSGIEVSKGASQISEGPFTTGGIINFISTPVPASSKGMIHLGAGSFGSRNIHAHFGDTNGGFGYMFETFQYKASGFKTIDFSDKNTGFDKKDYLAKLKWTSSSESKIYQRIGFKIGESSEHSNETYLGLSYEDFNVNPYKRYPGSEMDEMNTNHRQINLNYLISPIKNLYIQGIAYRNTFSRNWYKLDYVYNDLAQSIGIARILSQTDDYSEEYNLIKGESSSGNQELMVKANNRSYLSSGIQFKLNYFKDNHALELGFRKHYDEMDRFQWVDGYTMENGKMKLKSAGVRGTDSNRIESADAFASYIQYTWENDNWVFRGGLRREEIKISRKDFGKSDTERTGDNVSYRENNITAYIPGTSLTFKISDQEQIFGGIHKGFAPPGSSPSTNPEESINYELGYRIEKSNLFASAVLFFNNYQNLLGSDLASSGGTGNGDQFNGGSVESYGLEIAGNYRSQLTESIWIPIQIQYTYNQAKFTNSFESAFEPWGTVSEGDYIPYLAPHTFIFTSGLRGKRVGWNITGSYVDDMNIIATQSVSDDQQKINGRFLLSTNLSFQIKNDTHLRIGVQNLLNRKYAVAARPAGWRPGSPRNITISFQHHI